ncbi:MAG: hypothetical protein HY010_02740 [Acidobacteria bacterium]|nr:hypothetical protein [Acidobacteriota bacterium]
MIRENENAEAPPASAVPASLESFTHNISPEELLRAAANPALTEDLALSLLKWADLPVDVLDRLGKNTSVLKLRKVRLAVASHPHTPRQISIPLIRQFYTFDLMKIALTPGVPADVKVATDDLLISRLKTVTLGERLALARRGSGRVAGAMLLDGDARVMQIALENARLTETFVIQAVLRPEAKAYMVQAVAHHAKWSYRRELRIALLRTEYLSLARALEFSQGLPEPLLRDVLNTSRLPGRIKEQILREHQSRPSL